MEISLEEAFFGKKAEIKIPSSIACESCKGSGSKGGVAPSTCPTCRGAGKMRSQQGFFTVARTCGECRGSGRVVTKPCPTCRGMGATEQQRKLKVRIPAGIATGQRLRLTGEGEAGTLGGPPGDLYVVIDVEEHPFFQRDGNDLACQIPVNFTTLALGGEIKVPTIGGEQETLKIPEGTATGSLFRLRGKGMPDVSGRGRGDLLVTVQVLTPRKLTREQRKLLEQLAEALPPQEFEPTPRAADDRGLFEKVKDIFG